jgi:effector-binding domain-containing protein
MTTPTMAIETPTIGEAPRRFVLYHHVVASHAELKQTFDRVFGQLYAGIGAAGAVPAGPPFVIYNENSVKGVRWDMDVCAPVSAPVVPPVGLGFREMPAQRVVSLLHRGPYDTLHEAYGVIERYIADNGLAVTGAPREIYLTEPDVPAEQVLTQIEWPVA